MRTVTSASGKEEAVTLRRTESADAQAIHGLISSQTLELFGKVNIIHLLEKANLAVTLANEKEDILAHASFFDHPVGDLVDQTRWEPFLQKHFRAENCTPWNTLFLHLFLSQPDFYAASLKEIIRAVFNAVAELEHICLVGPHVGVLESALEDTFEPLQHVTEPGPACVALICHRQEHYPRLQIRTARVEDYDDIKLLFAEQMKQQSAAERPYWLTDLIEAQNENNHTAVCESDGVVVGFVSLTSDVDVKSLNQHFALRDFGGLYKKQQIGVDGAAARPLVEQTETQTSDPQQQEEAQATGRLSEKSNAFSVQFFTIDKKYEMRSVDFIPSMFNLFPDLDFCIIAVPTLSPEFPLLQSFHRVPRLSSSLLQTELYVLHRAGLRNVEVRQAVAADRAAVCDLVRGLRLREALLQDLDVFYETRRDQSGVTLQAFVVQVNGEVVGVLIIRDEQDMEYIRARYNIESFIYFSHHRYEEHAQIRHFVLEPSFRHHSKHVFKEVLRLARRSCLYHRLYASDHSQENSCVHHLDSVLNCAVPVRPRRQIIYPLEELGINAPSRQITEEQAPFSLSLISRKLTMEPKVTVNARIVVVGASDTALSFLEVLCSCPHLKFNNLTLVSTHGFPRDCNHDDDSDDHAGFLSTSHAYSRRELAQLPLQSCVTVVTAKMVGINRKSKYIRVCDGRKVGYDHLVLCTGLQYRVPRPSAVDLSKPVTSSQLQNHTAHQRHAEPVPSNLFTLNDLHDCRAARRWLTANFLELEDHAVVFGRSLDVFTTVQTLLGLGVRGSRIHLVQPPLDPGAPPCFGEPPVQRAVYAVLGKAEVQVHRDCTLAHVSSGDPLTSVSFTTGAQPLQLPCGVFINLSNRGVDYDAFRSISSSFLVFDSRLVINADFQTSDSAIFGAGPLTKFSPHYHADEWSHANFNSKEVGQELAATLLPLFDPTLEPAGRRQPGADRLVPLYKQAKIQGGTLPGGFNYLHVTKPTPSRPPGAPVKHLQDDGVTTGRAETGNYFCLRLDCLELVETLTCFSLKPLPVSNYLSLYGKHQQLLGQLCTFYYKSLIPDLYSFFTQSCCLAVFHDRFWDFEQELQQISSAKVDELRRAADNDDDDYVVPAEDVFKDGEDRAALTSGAVKYLTYNRNLLPMFACPGQL